MSLKRNDDQCDVISGSRSLLDPPDLVPPVDELHGSVVPVLEIAALVDLKIRSDDHHEEGEQ